MDEHIIGTPENVPIEFELAGLGSRVVAAVLDQLILTAVTMGVGTLTLLAFWLLGPIALRYTDSVLMVGAFLWMLIWLIGYDLCFEIIWNGQTPGKRRAGVRVVKDDGSPITSTAAVIRNVLRLVDFLPAYYIIAVISILVDRKGRRLGDLAAGTIVVKERRDVRLDRLSLSEAVPAEQPRESYIGEDAAITTNLHRLTSDDYYLIKEFLLRYDQPTSAAQTKLASEIAQRVAMKLGVPLGTESPTDLLHRVAAALERAGSS